MTFKAWTTQDGKPIDKGLIYKLINNRTYLGELRHKEQWYPPLAGHAGVGRDLIAPSDDLVPPGRQCRNPTA